MSIDLSQDKINAEAALKPFISDVWGSAQLHIAMKSVADMTDKFIEHYESPVLEWQIRMALSKAIVVEYAKPWFRNNENHGLKNAANSPELRPCRDADIHKSLWEIRNKIAAHSDGQYIGKGITLNGVRVVNDMPDHLPRTLEEVFLPSKVGILVGRSHWWFKDLDTLREIVQHAKSTETLATSRLHTSVTALLKECCNHVPVLSQLPDLLSINALTGNAGSFDISATKLEDQVSQSAAQALNIGSSALQELVTIQLPGAYFISDDPIRGDGFVITFKIKEDGNSASYTVSFPSRQP